MRDETKPRTTNKNHKIDENAFKKRFGELFCDQHFDPYRDSLRDIAEVAWQNYSQGRKAPYTVPAGPAYSDPNYNLSKDWIEASDAIKEAQSVHDGSGPARILLIAASDRNEGTCPSEISKTIRLTRIAQETFEGCGFAVEVLDLSEMTVEYGKMIYPCKGCVSTAMPLCHWPCSCYPNHSLGQTHDWMNEIYPMWVRAHGIMIITPVYWHQAPSCLKLMIDRLVCADGGNTDPTSTQGKKAELAKKMELDGWDYPRHLKGRFYSVIVHGDVVGVNELKLALQEWLSEMELLPAGTGSSLSRYIGYYEPYATSHAALDKDEAVMKEVANAAVALGAAVKSAKAGGLKALEPEMQDPRPK